MANCTASSAAAHSPASAAARSERNVRDPIQACTERLNDLIVKLCADADDVVRRHKPDYEDLKARLIEAGADSEWPSIHDVLTERVIEEFANLARPVRKSTSARDTFGDSVQARMPVSGRRDCADRTLATVLFTDIVNSTRHAAELGDRDWMELLKRHSEITSAEVACFGGRIVAHTGDGVVAIFDSPSCAVLCAATLTECIAELGVAIRAGVHTGECELRDDEVGGIAVHTGSRIAALARAGEVLVSRTVKELVSGSGISFLDCGPYVLRGVPGVWSLFACS